MLVAKVKGNIICTRKCAALVGARLLIVQPINPETMAEVGSHVVALDGMGAGIGEIVICVFGSSSMIASETASMPTDLSILAILDSIDMNGKRSYVKFQRVGDSI